MRSELTKLLHTEGVIRGSLLVRERTCGKARCRCVTKGQKHRSLYLSVRDSGKARQVFVPRALEDTVRRWVENHGKVKELIEEISQLHYRKLADRET